MSFSDPRVESNSKIQFSPLPQNVDHDRRRVIEPHKEQDSCEISSTSKRLTGGEELVCLGLSMFIVLFLYRYYYLGPPNEDLKPIFIINSMYLTNFTTGTGGLVATWDTKFTVINPNVACIYFRSIDFTIFYKQNPEDALAIAASYPFNLDQGESVKLYLRFTTNGTKWDQDDEFKPFVENQLVEEIGKDKDKNGYLSFGMQMKVHATYFEESIWALPDSVVMTPHCDDLKVQFLHNKNSGMLVIPNRNCSIPVQ